MNNRKYNNKNIQNEIQEKGRISGNNIVAIDISLSEIDKNEDNEKIFSVDDIEYLAEGIKEEGFYGAIEVYKKPDGRYEISSGHRRYEAMKLLGKDVIPCIVSEMPSDINKAKKLLSSNIRSRKLTPMDMARSLNYYKNILANEPKKKDNNVEKKTKRQRMAEYFNISEAMVQRYMSLLSLIPELQELANNPAYPYSAFSLASSLSEEEQEELYQMIIEFLEENREKTESKEREITRVRIRQMISMIKRDKELCVKENKVEEENESENEQLEIPISVLETDIMENELPYKTENDNEEEMEFHFAEEPTIDVQLSVYAGEMRKMTSHGCHIKDRDSVISYISEIKKVIQKIEEQLNM